MIVRPSSLMSMYLELKEAAGSADDFPYLLGNYQHKLLVDAFKGIPSTWPLWCWRTEVSDFKAHYRNMLGELQDLIQKPYPGAHQEDQNVREDKWQIAAVEWGRDFSIGRQTIINDDLQAFQTVPQKLGRAAARTVAKYAVVTILEANPNAYDGVTLFHATNHVGIANLVTTALTLDATGLAALETAYKAILGAKDEDGNKVGVMPKYLMVPIALKFVAEGFYNNDTVGVGAAQTTNTMKGKLVPLTEPFLTSATKWYLFADPADVPCIEIAFLNGKDVPDLLVKKPEYASLAGGDDPFGYEFGDLNYRARYDFGGAVGYYQGAYRGGS
jgi:hypothetical protein